MKNSISNYLRFYAFFILVASTITPALSQVPSDFMENCQQWKITYPTGTEDKTLCNEPNNEFFYVNEANTAIVFRAPIRNDNGTTPNSSNIRSELRERKPDGSADVYWTTEGTHSVYVKQAITHLPINKSQLVATQIHGNKEDGIDDSMVMRLEDTHLFLSFNGGKLRSNITIKSNYVLGTIHEVIFLVVDDKHYCYYAEDGNLFNAYNNGTAEAYLIKDGDNDFVMDLNYDQSYFKIGNYTQSNANAEGTDTDNPNNYGEVLVYDFSVQHGIQNVSGVSLAPNTANLSLGNSLQLTPSIRPASATNLGVSYSTSDASIATVNETGLVTGLAKGTATITVTTNDGGFTASSNITIIAAASGPNLALHAATTGTGTADGENIVSNLVDDETDTRWSVSGFPQTATINLGTVYSLGRTELVCYSDRAYQFTVSAATTENGPYTELVNRIENTTPGTSENPIIDIFSAVDAQFLKITTTGAATYSGSWVSLAEFRVFASEALSIDTYQDVTENTLLWPNPASNFVKLKNFQNFEFLEIYNQLGTLISSQPLETETIAISNLNSGLYLFKFIGKNSILVKPLVKK
ncbi:polysaccharide lyase family 7 protein [Flavicella sediminum]|uniref:polysaccharide lyase family 7 protein n=1 Tax=Flavicella sediminum TaxID=2585141 RepID=UPI002938D555|nr:polysaccharide lyase family 7 protein [Flavicella sediminum]